MDDTRVATSTRTEYYQLKNKDKVSWSDGTHSIAGDFQKQYKLATHLKESMPTTGLVVANEGLRDSLTASMPTSIMAHSSVHYFPWLQTANRLVIESPAVRELLKKLAKIEDPTVDVLTSVLGALLIGCIEHPDGASVEDIVSCACRLFPSQVRSFPASEDWERHFTAPFRQVLAQIPGLSYGAKRGYFHWSAFGTSGDFGSNCLSDEFNEFQERIAKNMPKTFEEFEKFLP